MILQFSNVFSFYFSLQKENNWDISWGKIIIILNFWHYFRIFFFFKENLQNILSLIFCQVCYPVTIWWKKGWKFCPEKFFTFAIKTLKQVKYLHVVIFFSTWKAAVCWCKEYFLEVRIFIQCQVCYLYFYVKNISLKFSFAWILFAS